MTDQNEENPHWGTDVRIVVHDATAMPSPEVRALARLNMFVSCNAIAKFSPVARRFATMADEHRRGLTTCTPTTLSATIWVPRPPAVLCSYGSAIWDYLTPALTRGVARIDMAKIARMIWTEGPTHDPLRMADFVQTGGPAWVSTGSDADSLARQAQAVADMMSVALLVSGELLIELAAARSPSSSPTLDDAFGGMSGDPRLEAMVRLSEVPMPPLRAVPAPWDELDAWFALASDELAWVASDANASDYERETAAAELARRIARDEALLRPRPLLRSPGPG